MDELSQIIADSAADSGITDDAGTVDTSSTTTLDTEPTAEAAPSGEAAPTPDPAPAAAPAVVEDDDFTKVPERTADGRYNRIPHNRVSAMVAKARETARQEAIAEREAHIRETFGLAADAPIDFTPIKERYTKAGEYEQQFQAMAAVERMMAEKPEEFLRSLAEQIPAYKAYLPQAAAAAQATAPQSSGMPEPDLDLGDGRRTYSVDGLQRLREWDRNEAVRIAKAEMTQEFSKRFEPFEQQQRVAKLRETARQRLTALHTETQNWPMFAEHETAILDRMRTAYPNAAPEVALNNAYRDVVIPKMQTSEADLRKKIVEEMNAKPRATAAPTASAPAAPVVKPGEDPMTAIIRREAEKLGLK